MTKTTRLPLLIAVSLLFTAPLASTQGEELTRRERIGLSSKDIERRSQEQTRRNRISAEDNDYRRHHYGDEYRRRRYDDDRYGRYDDEGYRRRFGLFAGDGYSYYRDDAYRDYSSYGRPPQRDAGSRCHLNEGFGYQSRPYLCPEDPPYRNPPYRD